MPCVLSYLLPLAVMISLSCRQTRVLMQMQPLQQQRQALMSPQQ